MPTMTAAKAKQKYGFYYTAVMPNHGKNTWKIRENLGTPKNIGDGSDVYPDVESAIASLEKHLKRINSPSTLDVSDRQYLEREPILLDEKLKIPAPMRDDIEFAFVKSSDSDLFKKAKITNLGLRLHDRYRYRFKVDLHYFNGERAGSCYLNANGTFPRLALYSGTIILTTPEQVVKHYETKAKKSLGDLFPATPPTAAGSPPADSHELPCATHD